MQWNNATVFNYLCEIIMSSCSNCAPCSNNAPCFRTMKNSTPWGTIRGKTVFVYCIINSLFFTMPAKKKTDKDSDISSCKSAGESKEKARIFEQRVFVIDTEQLAGNTMTLAEQTTGNRTSLKDSSKFYRISGRQRTHIQRVCVQMLLLLI